SVYVVGNIPELGAWNTDRAVKLEPNGPYPAWTGTIGRLPANTSVEWKCIKRLEAGEHPQVIQWQPGANSTFTTPTSGTAGQQRGAF
ncbi:MAG: glycoside hydrolase family 31, partial [Proteobacteria bacterium]|nr:glycoside hydrolase family 31 [Pseudomonadota bacterium]